MVETTRKLYKVVYWHGYDNEQTPEETYINARTLRSAKQQASMWRNVKGRWYQCQSWCNKQKKTVEIDEYVKIGSSHILAPRLFVIPLIDVVEEVA